MKNEITVKQTSLILMLVITGGKYLSLPRILAEQVGRDSWLTVLILLAVDFICLAFFLWAIKLNKNKLSFYQTLSATVGAVVSKIILVIFACFLVIRVVGMYSGVYQLFVATFGIRTNWFGFILPIGALVMFSVSRGMRAIGRLNQLLFVLILLSLVAIIVTPAMHIQLSELQPVAEDGFGKIFKTAAVNSFWFSDYAFIYFIMGDVKREKRVFTPACICFAAGAALTVAMYILFTGLYGDMMQYTDLAMSKVSQFSITAATSGRLDWLFVTIWTMSMFIKITVFTFSLYKCFEHLFGINESKFNPWLCIGVLSFALLPLFVTAETLNRDVTKYLMYPFWIIQYVLPLCMPLLVKKANDKTDLQKIPFVKSNDVPVGKKRKKAVKAIER
ncbi:MAG: spore germination protein [Corallococcus sp.]|nr:spore germination protein [Corallococcus sp.]